MEKGTHYNVPQPTAMFNQHVEYTPLNENEIRILTIEADALADAKIVCTLKHANLKALKKPYIALSYVWGDQNTRREILVDGQVFSATKNLEMR
jgi:hypothetical protein